MAFPTLGVLDNFNTTASQNLTARSGWGASVLVTADSTFATDGTPTLATHGSGTGSNYWNTSSADAEVYCSISQYNGLADDFVLCSRITATGAMTCYAVYATGASGVFQICKYVTGTKTTLGTAVGSVFLAAGDKVGLSVVGTTITSYYFASGGAWVQKDSITDSSITGAGFTGGFDKPQVGGTLSIDDFGGGALVSGPSSFGVQMSRGGDRHSPVFA